MNNRADKTLARMSQRFTVPTPSPQSESDQTQSTAPVPQSKAKSLRARQTLFCAHQSIKDIDDAYRKANHEAYPGKINKADFIEALIAIGLKHIEEVLEQTSQVEQG